MNLNNEQVVHHTFGVGQVVSVGNGTITIRFAEDVGQKLFQYPGAFESHLKMCNPSAQDFVWGELKKFMNQFAAEQAYKKQQQLEKMNRLVAIRDASRKSLVKKPKRITNTKKDNKTAQ